MQLRRRDKQQQLQIHKQMLKVNTKMFLFSCFIVYNCHAFLSLYFFFSFNLFKFFLIIVQSRTQSPHFCHKADVNAWETLEECVISRFVIGWKWSERALFSSRFIGYQLYSSNKSNSLSARAGLANQNRGHVMAAMLSHKKCKQVGSEGEVEMVLRCCCGTNDRDPNIFSYGST